MHYYFKNKQTRRYTNKQEIIQCFFTSKVLAPMYACKLLIFVLKVSPKNVDFINIVYKTLLQKKKAKQTTLVKQNICDEVKGLLRSLSFIL